CSFVADPVLAKRGRRAGRRRLCLSAPKPTRAWKDLLQFANTKSSSQQSTAEPTRRVRRIRIRPRAVVGSSMSSQTTKPAPVRHAQAGGEKVARSDAFEWLARAGFVARGLIYGIIGILAIKLAVGAGGKTASQQGALKTIAQQPFGRVLLILVAIGLAGYAFWRILRALLGHGPEASDTRFERFAAFASGLVYAGLCAIAVKILAGSDSSGSENVHRKTAGAFGWPAGTWLVGIAGAVLIGVGLYQCYRGISRDFLKDSKTEEMSPAVRNWIEWIGSFGHLARGVVFGMV